MLEITAVPQRALAVYAHPDDPEVSAGGTIARWAEAGCEVHVLVTTLGDKGSDDPQVRPAELADRRCTGPDSPQGRLNPVRSPDGLHLCTTDYPPSATIAPPGPVRP